LRVIAMTNSAETSERAAGTGRMDADGEAQAAGAKRNSAGRREGMSECVVKPLG
jgi:hypothetical protein